MKNVMSADIPKILLCFIKHIWNTVAITDAFYPLYCKTAHTSGHICKM